MAAWFIDDLNRRYIQITDINSVYYNVPKMQNRLTIEGDIVHLYWSDLEYGDGGYRRHLPLNYLDVVDNYSGYIDNPSSATDLATQLEAMFDTAWTSIAAGGALVNKGDIMSNNGASDEIFPLGTNEFVHVVDTTESTGHKYVAKSNIVDGGLGVTNTDSAEITKVVNSISVRTLSRSHPPVAISSWNPLDATTYHFNNTGNVVNTGAANLKNITPAAGTLLGVHVDWTSTGVAGSNENVSLYIRKNDTTDYLIATVGNTNAVKIFENLAMNAGAGVTFNGTDYYCYKMTPTTWVAQNPTAVGIQGWTEYKLT